MMLIFEIPGAKTNQQCAIKLQVIKKVKWTYNVAMHFNGIVNVFWGETYCLRFLK